MARYLILWRMSSSALQPTDPSKSSELNEKMFAGIDGLIKKGDIEECGAFPDGTSGYVIAKGETIDIFRDACMFQPYILVEVHEIIPYEKQKEILRALLKAQIPTAKK